MAFRASRNSGQLFGSWYLKNALCSYRLMPRRGLRSVLHTAVAVAMGLG